MSTLIRSLQHSILVLVFASFVAACGGGDGAASGPILIKFPHVTAPTTPKGRAAERFEQLVEERLAGRVEVEVYPSSQLMNDDDSLDALAFGEIQMIAISLSKLDRLTNSFQIFDLPFLFPDLDTVEAFQGSDTAQVMMDSMNDKGLLGLTYWHNGMKQFGGPIDMRAPDNADGLKFRIMESDVLEAQMRTIGGNPQKMALGEVYQALQTGAIDAQENTWSNMWSSKFYEVQDYLTETNHGYLGYLVMVNQRFWEGLPEDIRTELESIVFEVADWANAQSAQINADGRQRVIDSGASEVVGLTQQETANWEQAMRPVWAEFEELIGADLIEAALAARE